MTIERFAEKHNLKTSRDECGDIIAIELVGAKQRPRHVTNPPRCSLPGRRHLEYSCHPHSARHWKRRGWPAR
jgi:hypothetical protein